MSPTTNTSGCPGRVRSGSTAMRPARSSSAPVALASSVGQRRRLHPGRPHGGVGVQPAGGAAPSVMSTPVASTLPPGPPCAARRRDARAPWPPCPTAGRRRWPGAPCRRRAARLAPRRLEGAELAPQAAHRQLPDLAGQLHPGGPGPDDGNGQPALSLGRVRQPSRPSRRPRRSAAAAPWASSMVFMPGAYRAYSSCPK